MLSIDETMAYQAKLAATRVAFTRRPIAYTVQSMLAGSYIGIAVVLADEAGSTEKLIKTIAAAPAGTKLVVGTELNLVRRLGQQFPEQQISFLEKNVCYCSTMNRIDLPHLVWALESLVEGRVVNPIRVDPDVAHHARIALDQMLALPGETHKD